MFQAVSGQGAKKILVASLARWEEQQRMLSKLEQKNQELWQTIEQRSERQELLAAQMERMKILQKDALEKFLEQIF